MTASERLRALAELLGMEEIDISLAATHHLADGTTGALEHLRLMEAILALVAEGRWVNDIDPPLRYLPAMELLNRDWQADQ